MLSCLAAEIPAPNGGSAAAASSRSRRSSSSSSAEPERVVRASLSSSSSAPPCLGSREQYSVLFQNGERRPQEAEGKDVCLCVFCADCREEHKKKKSGGSREFRRVSKKCSERWKTMSTKEKGKFDEMAKADKVRYDREMKDYGPAKGGKKKKDPNAPKRPPSGFSSSARSSVPKSSPPTPAFPSGT
ncbi:high mobility group protein B3 [Thamnophis elegans]|uniref:high mobility group protein B3 n=1 Tax=Thamnophis elegans TaxID=35005 RepID=UPI001378B831|nr:high mobility group protein B3 [Thamnophis elegans]